MVSVVHGPGRGLSWYVLHRHLGREPVSLLLDGVAYKCQSCHGLLNLSHDLEIIDSLGGYKYVTFAKDFRTSNLKSG